MCCNISGGRNQRACKFTHGFNIMFVCLQMVLSRRDDVEGVEMDTQSCVDHSILAIFEDSTVASEVRVKADKCASRQHRKPF